MISLTRFVLGRASRLHEAVRRHRAHDAGQQLPVAIFEDPAGKTFYHANCRISVHSARHSETPFAFAFLSIHSSIDCQCGIRMFVAPRYRRPVSIIVALTFITTTSGCTGIPGIGGSANLTVDPGDPCGPQRAAFAQSNEFFTADVLKTVGFATLAGAGAGAGIGAIAGGGRGALTGALIGGGLALGGSLLYSYSQYLQEHTTNTGEFASKVDQDMRRDPRRSTRRRMILPSCGPAALPMQR